jgi:hypothetical protein
VGGLLLATERLIAAPDAAVVAFAPGREAAVRDALAHAGDVSPLDAPGSVVVRLRHRSASPHEAWSAMLASCPEALWVAPVLRDSAGNELFPTGAVTVRFRSRLADAALGAFAASLAFTLERRNEFVPEQATFRPREPRGVFLPDLIDRITQLPEVAQVWAATVSHYRYARGGGPPFRET